jgi:hypothetical protein
VKKGRHRRFEEARALKRSSDINLDELFESLQADGTPVVPPVSTPGRAPWDEDEDDDDLEDEDE